MSTPHAVAILSTVFAAAPMLVALYRGERIRYRELVRVHGGAR